MYEPTLTKTLPRPSPPWQRAVDAACDAVQRREDGQWYFHMAMSQADRDAFDAHLVAIKHPLAYEPGTQEQRFRAYVAEIVAKQGDQP